MDNQWRKLYSTEKQKLLSYFTIQHKIVKWFFTIWISFGYLAIGGWIITYFVELINNGFDLMTTIMMPIAMIIVYLFFIKLGHKLRDEWSCRELHALKKDTAIICKASVIDKKQVYAGRNDNRRKYNYYVIVNIEWQGENKTVDIPIALDHYRLINPGEIVYVFNISYQNPHIIYLSAYPEQWLMYSDYEVI